MAVPLKFLLILSLALIAASQQLETDYIHEPDENTRVFILQENEEMRKFLKEEMQKMFATMSETFGEQLLQSESKVKGELLETLQENHQQVSRLISNLTTALVPPTFTEVQKMFATILKTLSDQQRRSDLKVSGELGSLNEKLQADHQHISESISSLTTAIFPPTLTEMEEVNAGVGSIEFSGGTNLHLRTKIWVLRSKRGTSFRVMSFLLVANGLGEAARLSLWGSDLSDGKQTMWSGSQANWRDKRENGGNVILVTLRISPGRAETPSFKLKFNTTATRSVSEYSSAVFGGKGRQEVSFPLDNTEEYPPKCLFVAVVASPRGGSSRLSLRFLDLPGSPPDKCDNDFDLWFLKETPNGLPFTRLPPSAYTRCGRIGAISEPLGNSTVAILRFWTWDRTVGTGFKVQVN